MCNISSIFKCFECFSKWLKALKNKIQLRNQIFLAIKKLIFFGKGEIKTIRNGVIELTIGTTEYRVYCAKNSQNEYIFLCGGNKNTQDNDIKKAIKLKQNGLDNYICHPF